MDNLVKMTIYGRYQEQYRGLAMRREFFTGDFPASTLARSLAKPEVLVEIETVAYLGRS
jgi:enamine deaminase RidA (YjgF/YER057c/UK114 family)